MLFLQCQSNNPNIFSILKLKIFCISKAIHIPLLWNFVTWVTWLGTFFYCIPKFTLKLHLHSTTKPFHITYDLLKIWQLSHCCVISTWELCMKLFPSQMKEFLTNIQWICNTKLLTHITITSTQIWCSFLWCMIQMMLWKHSFNIRYF